MSDFEQDPEKLARNTDPDTSKDASYGLGRNEMCRKLLIPYLRSGLTAEDAAEAAGYTPADGAWKRVSDLKNLGLVAPSGRTKKGSRGRQQDILVITSKGIAALASLGLA